MAKLGLGVVGVGEMGHRHAENLRWRVPGAQLVAIADLNLEYARRVAEKLEVAYAHPSASALVEHREIHAVVIASPPGAHPEAIHAAAAAGKHIFCEKPLALSLEAADAALAAVARAGVQFQIGHMRRYDPPYSEAMTRIESGEIGQPVIFKSLGRDAEAPPLTYFQSPLNGSLFLDSSIHDFDLARWLMRDEVAEVHAFVGTRAMPELREYHQFDSGVVNLRFMGGALGNVESFLNARYAYDVRTEVVGTHGTLRIGTLRGTAIEVLSEPGSHRNTVRHWLVRFADAYLAEMCDFVNAVASGRPTRVTADDGRRSLALALAAEQSFRQQRSILL
jgi:scyllo-inositol 2-dehydrogenase (NAD+)